MTGNLAPASPASPTSPTGSGGAGGAAADELLIGYTRALRAAGLGITHDRVQAYLAAVSTVGLADRQACYWAGRATLCSSPDDAAYYDQVFTAWFLDQQPGRTRREPTRTITQAALEPTDAGGAMSEGEGDSDAIGLLRVRASDAEVLRHRDIAELSAAERARLAEMFSDLRPRPPRRRGGRRTPWHRGGVDAHRTLRRTLDQLGEPAPIAWRRRGTVTRRLVLLIDVSGSMSGYVDALLRLAHRFNAAGGGRVESFTMGTRLTRITPALRYRDPDRALVAVGDLVPDWSGGTRLGESIGAFVDRWGRRSLARGAVVAIFSDGWERGGTSVLDEQVGHLAALAHRVIWVNPHVGRSGYEPVQQGIVAVLPHLDSLVSGHSLQTFAELVELVADA